MNSFSLINRLNRKMEKVKDIDTSNMFVVNKNVDKILSYLDFMQMDDLTMMYESFNGSGKMLNIKISSNEVGKVVIDSYYRCETKQRDDIVSIPRAYTSSIEYEINDETTIDEIFLQISITLNNIMVEKIKHDK